MRGMRSPILRATKQRALLMDKLSPKEVVYIEARINGSLPVPAARLAGYPDADEAAARNEQNQLLRAAIRAQLQVSLHGRNITRDDVLAGFLDAVNMAQTSTELTGAWREIAKVVGAYEPKKIDLTVHGINAIKEMTDDQLLEMAAVEGEFEVLDFDNDEDFANDNAWDEGSYSPPNRGGDG